MSDEIISRPNIGSNISFADDDAIGAIGGATRPVASWITSKGLTNTEAEDTCSRNVRSFMTFRASGLSTITTRDLPTFDSDKMFNHRRDSPQQRHARVSSIPKQDRNDEIEGVTQRYENAVLRYQRSKSRPRRQISRERQQQQCNYSSSDESVARNKSKSTSSIDTQSVNNILDEYEDLDYRRSSDLSDVGSINVTNFEAIMMDHQKRQQQQQQQQQQGRTKLTSAKIQTRSIPTREKIQPVLKVNQQTQVRQRSRDRQKDSGKGHQQDSCSPVTTDVIESGRSKMPEILLRKGEVQKRVDEWLNQAHSQNFPASSREKPLTRSNSSVEQKSQRRYRGQDPRSRLIDEARDRLNGGASSSYDDLTRVERKIERGRLDKVNVGVNTSRGTYKEYLAARSKIKQQDYGFSAQSCVASSRSGDSNPASRIPQRGPPLGSSFRSRRAEANPEEGDTTESRITNSSKKSESDHGRAIANNSKMAEVSSVVTTSTTTSIIPCKRPSLKRSSGNDVNQNCAATRSLVKEETDPRSSRATSLSKGPADSLGDQGESISPNKDGESRRPAATAASESMSRPATAIDKAIEGPCKSTEALMRSANHPRDSSSRIISTTEFESPRHRSQISGDIRKESRSLDQPLQEQSIYGLAVSARVRALQCQAESRNSRTIRCHQIGGAPIEVRKPVLLRRDHGVSPSRDVSSQDQAKASIGASSSSFKPHDRAYTTSGLNGQNIVAKTKIATCEIVPSGRITRYASPDHVERIYERSLQPQVIHADNLESILRPSLQVSPYGEKVGVSRSDRESSSVKETSTVLEGEQTSDRIGETRHEHLETIEEDDRKSEGSICRYPEIGLKQCLKVQQSLPNNRTKESTDKRKKDNSSIYVKRTDWQQVVNEPARTFATFQLASTCQSNAKSSFQPRSSEMRESRGHEETRQDLDEPTTIHDENFATDYDDASREDPKQLTIHSRENSNLSTATIPVDELENQRGSRFKIEEDIFCNRLQPDEKSQDRLAQDAAKNADERGAVVNEILVKNLQFEQDLPGDSIEQTRPDHVVQQMNFRNVLCDDYENVKLKNKKVYMTKEEMDHQRLIDMLRKRDFETLKTVSDYIELVNI